MFGGSIKKLENKCIAFFRANDSGRFLSEYRANKWKCSINLLFSLYD